MSDTFASPKRRLARAKDHISDLKARIISWGDREPYAKVVEPNARGFDEHKVKVAIPLPDVVTDIGYETIEALRSSLDQATYAVAIACKAKRPDLIHFPIADNVADFENVLKGWLRDFPPASWRSFAHSNRTKLGTRSSGHSTAFAGRAPTGSWFRSAPRFMA
jgi:hypothetical protein